MAWLKAFEVIYFNNFIKIVLITVLFQNKTKDNSL